MDPSTLAPKRSKPSAWWILVTIVAGAVGALAAIAAGGKGTYDIAPFTVELRARPAPAGKTELAIRPIEQLLPSHAEAGTHAGPMAFRATIIDVSPAFLAGDRIVAQRPYDFAQKLAQDGKDAMRSFGIKLGLLALAGAAAAGVAVSMGRWQRILGAMVSGLLTFAVIGFVIQQTYDSSAFLRTSYVVTGSGIPGAPVPSQ